MQMHAVTEVGTLRSGTQVQPYTRPMTIFVRNPVRHPRKPLRAVVTGVVTEKEKAVVVRAR